MSAPLDTVMSAPMVMSPVDSKVTALVNVEAAVSVATTPLVE